MAKDKIPEDRLAPIFIVADDDREALDKLLKDTCFAPCFFIPVSEPRQMVRYARNFATTAVFLADQVNHPKGGSERLLREILQDVEKPVVILAEDWTPQAVERWKRLGAKHCLPHPTRTKHRLELFRQVLEEFAFAKIDETLASAPPPPDEDRS